MTSVIDGDGVLKEYTGWRTQVSIPEGVTKIDDYVFAMRPVEQIFIPTSVTEIGNYAFSNCQRLYQVTFAEDSKLYKIGDFAFETTVITEIRLPDGVREIGSQAFYNCYYLNTVILPEGLTEIPDYMVYACGKSEKHQPSQYTEDHRSLRTGVQRPGNAGIPAGLKPLVLTPLTVYRFLLYRPCRPCDHRNRRFRGFRHYRGYPERWAEDHRRQGILSNLYYLSDLPGQRHGGRGLCPGELSRPGGGYHWRWHHQPAGDPLSPLPALPVFPSLLEIPASGWWTTSCSVWMELS